MILEGGTYVPGNRHTYVIFTDIVFSSECGAQHIFSSQREALHKMIEKHWFSLSGTSPHYIDYQVLVIAFLIIDGMATGYEAHCFITKEFHLGNIGS